MKGAATLFILLPLLCQGLEDIVEQPVCNLETRRKYCNADYGGDLHTGCKYCGLGPQCPQGVTLSGRGLSNRTDLRDEILRRHNEYRADVRAGLTRLPATNCIPDLSWDEELAEVAQIWADQCANVIYFHNSDMYPRIFHERGFERTTSRFHSPPGVGQNVAWALTKHVNFTRIIDDLWYRDINKLKPGRIGDFQVDPSRMDTNLVTQILWGRTTHVGCGWTQFPLLEGSSKFEGIYAEGEYENFFVCNYGVGGNVPGEPVYNMECFESQQDSKDKEAVEMLNQMEIKFKDGFKDASALEKGQINVCLDTLTCLSQQSSADKSCSQLEFQCVIEVPPKFPDGSNAYFQSEFVQERIAQIECKIEALLCTITQKQDCGLNLENCLLDYDYYEDLEYDLTMTSEKPGTSIKKDETTLRTLSRDKTTLRDLFTNVESTTFNPSRTTTLKELFPAEKPTIQTTERLQMSSERPKVVTSEKSSTTEKIVTLPNAFTEPTSTTIRVQPRTEDVETTTKKVVVLLTTTRPVVIQSSTSSMMTGSTSLDIDEITTQLPKMDVELTTVRPVSQSFTTRPTSTLLSTTKSAEVVAKTTPSQKQDQFQITTLKEEGVQSTEKSTELRKSTRKEDEILPQTTTLRSNLLDFLANNMETTTLKEAQQQDSSSPIQMSDLLEMIMTNQTEDLKILGENDFDVSFYNSTSKTSFRLAVCLDGITCEASPRCTLVHTKCNEGMDVTGIPHRVRQKLSECSVDDILCHLNANPNVMECQRTFEKCVKIVVPVDFLPMVFSDSTSLTEDTTLTPIEDTTPTLDPVSILGGLASMTQKENDVLNELTSNVLSAIQNSTEGFTIEPLVGNFSIADLLESNDTLPFFQDFIILLNDTSNFNETDIEDPSLLDLTDASIIFNPATLAIGDDKTIITPRLNQTLRENIINAVKDFATVCTVCNSTTDTAADMDDSDDQPQQVDPQVQLAVCLKGVECEDPETCKKAQKLCLGEEIFINFNDEQRKQLSECYIDNYLCILKSPTDADCESNLKQCLSIKATDFAQKGVITIEEIISQVAGDISNIITEEEVDDQSQEIVISGINEPIKEEGTVSINLNSTDGPIILTSSTPVVKFDEIKNTVTVKVDRKELEGKETEERKEITKERIEEALRQIFILSQPVVKPKPDETSLAHIIASTISGYIEESDKDVPNTIGIAVETEKDLDVPEVDILAEEEDTFVTIVKLPGEIDQKIEFKVPISVKEGQDNVDIDELADDISAEFDKALTAQEDQPKPVSEVVSTAVTEYVDASGEKPDKVIVKIEKNTSVEIPSLEIETESPDTLKTTLTLPSNQDSTEEFEVDLDQSPDGSLNLKNLKSQINDKLEDSERSTTPRSIEQKKESIDNLAKDVAEAIKKATENQDPPKQISIAYQGHSDGLKGPEFMVRGNGDVLFAVIETPSKKNFTERVDISLDGQQFEQLEEVLNETFKDIEASNNDEPAKDVTQMVVEMVEEAIENREIPAEIPAKVTITVEADDSIDVPNVELEDMDQDSINMKVVIPSKGDEEQKAEKVVIEVPLNQNPDFEKEVSQKLNEVINNEDQTKPAKDLLTEISDKVNEFIKDNDMNLPEEIIVTVETKNDIKETEIKVENEGGKVTTVVKIPDENEKFFEFNIPTQSITNEEGETLAKDKLEVALKDNLAEIISTTEKARVDQPNLADFIADTIGQFIDDTSVKTPEKAQIEVETQESLTSPEIELEPMDSGDLKTTIKLPGEQNQAVKFEVPIQVSDQDMKVDRSKLSNAIANGFDEALEKAETTQKTEENLPNIIASTTANFIEDKGTSTTQINVNIETNPDLTTPKIEVQETEDGIKTVVKLPGDKEESTQFTIPATNKDKVDVEALTESISNQFDLISTSSTMPTITTTQASTIETISDKVTEAIEELSQGQTTPKIVNVDVQPSDNQEPSVTITSTTEDGSIVKATVKVPKDDQDLLPVAIAVPQEVASGDIDKTALTERITTMLTSSTPPTVVKVDSKDIAETVAEAINETIDKDNKDPPRNVKLNITFNEEILEPQVEIKGIDEDVVIAHVQVPGDNDKPEQVIEVPLKTDSTSKIDRDQLENEFSDKLKEIVSFGTTTSKPKTLAEEISKSIIDKVNTTDEQPPKKATINIEDSTDTQVEFGSFGVDDIEIMVKTPTKQKEQVQVDIPIKDGTTKEIDKEKLSRRIEDALNEASIITTTPTSVTSKDDFILSIDKFGITVGTLKPQDIVVTTIKSIIEDISERVTTTEDMSDLMSVSEFGFTISAPSKDSTTTRKNDKVEGFGVGSTTTRKNDRLEDFIGPTETSVPRPDLNDIDDSTPSDDKSRPTSTLRSLDTTTFAVDVSPSYTRVSTNIPAETTTARLIDKSTIRDESGIKVTLTFSTESTPTRVEPSIAEQSTKSIDQASQETSTARSSSSTTTTTEASFFSGGILDRVRDITIALIAGLIAQYAGFSPFAPVQKNDETEGVLVPFEPKLPNVIAKDPFVRNKVKESEGAYDGNIFNLTIPIKPEEIPELQDEKIRQDISSVVKQAIGSDGSNITVSFGDQESTNLVINAQTGPVDTRPKTPRLDDDTTTKPKIENEPPEFRFVTSSRPPVVVTSRTLPPFVDLSRTTTRPPRVPTRTPAVPPQVFTTSTTVYVSPTEPSRVQFELTDAITSSTTTTTDFPLSEYVPFEDDIGNAGGFFPPLITQDQVEEILDSVPVDENRIFDSRLNFLGESSVNVVEATVVEDLNYARSVRESASTLGIATISSITVGVIALLAFSLLIFMALARRRRRRKYDTTAASSAAMTPTQSRTTFSGTPIMADTPSMSNGGFGEDPLNTTGSSTIDPVVHIDGHQTIISSYNEFMSLPNESRNNIMNNLPSPTSEGSETNLVPRTQNLIENSPFLFAPSLATASPRDRHYP